MILTAANGSPSGSGWINTWPHRSPRQQRPDLRLLRCVEVPFRLELSVVHGHLDRPTRPQTIEKRWFSDGLGGFEWIPTLMCLDLSIGILLHIPLDVEMGLHQRSGTIICTRADTWICTHFYISVGTLMCTCLCTSGMLAPGSPATTRAMIWDLEASSPVPSHGAKGGIFEKRQGLRPGSFSRR